LIVGLIVGVIVGLIVGLIEGVIKGFIVESYDRYLQCQRCKKLQCLERSSPARFENKTTIFYFKNALVSTTLALLL
jgi:hypothetical protein